MTLSIAWIRKSGNHEQLVFASDSRLRSFGSWDTNPKIFPLERSDCAISFAGDTDYSYPLITQIQSFIRSYPKSQSRYQDLRHFKGHLLNMINHVLQFKSDYEVPMVRFLFGGYSWQKRKFCLWHIFFDKTDKQFVGPEVHTWRGLKVSRPISFIGDYYYEYRERLITMMKERKKFLSGHFDMEPFEVLVQMLKEGGFIDIGGPPQLLKVYEHMNRIPIAVKWNTGQLEYLSLLGRPLQEYEKTIFPTIDTETLKIEGGFSFG